MVEQFPSSLSIERGHSMSLGLCPTKLPVTCEARADHPCVPAKEGQPKIPQNVVVSVIGLNEHRNMCYEQKRSNELAQTASI